MASAPTSTSTARNRTSQRPGRSSTASLQPRERPRGDLSGRLVRIVEALLHGVPFGVAAHVACRDERVEPQAATVVPRHVEPLEAPPQVVGVAPQPLDEGDVRGRILAQRLAGSPLLDAAVPRADVLADIAAVDLRAEL